MSSPHGMDVGELLRAVDAGRPLVLLDLRNHEEVARWRVEGRRPLTIVHIPYFDFIEDTEEAIARVPRDTYVVALCAKGGSSAMVVDLLRDAGIAARNLDGGMEAYGAHLEATRAPTPAGYRLWQIHRRGTGCLSYVVEAEGEALVVDPSRATEWYERFVTTHALRVVRVVDTHLHADHVSGGPALAARLGVPYAPGLEAGSDLADGAVIRLGTVDVRALATPGHTPGSTSYRVGYHLLSGDTLFVRGVGRPDLGERAHTWARELYRTLHDRLGALPDGAIVLPAHAGGMDEVGDDGIVSARLGALRATPELRLPSEDAFAHAIAAGVEPPPLAYREIVRANAERLDVAPERAAQWELGRNQCGRAVGD